ncbi:MAG: hypothetical protein V4692_01225, partial [Bdellovibrionota bacterium]
MLKIFLGLLFGLSIYFGTANAQSEPGKVEVKFEKIYTVNGFDSNDQVQLIAEGSFKNSCYRPASPTVKVIDSEKTIELTPMAYEYSGMCLQVVLPFQRVIDIG